MCDRVAFVLRVLVLGAVGLAACRGQEKPADKDSAPAPLVEALPAKQGRLPVELRASGIVRAQNQVEIRPEIAAVVAEVLVGSGDRVTKGQPLVRLSPEPQRQELRAGEANADLADAAAQAARARVVELEAQATRTRKLADRKMVSELERETHDAQLAAAEAAHRQSVARVAEARASVGLHRSTLDKTVIRAPVAGRVGRRAAENGLLVTPATVLFVVGDLDHVIVDLPLSEKMLARVRPGQPVTLRGPALGDATVAARLARISPFLERGSFSTTGEVEVDNRDGRLLPGMFVSADIAVGDAEAATLVPVSALAEDARTGLLTVHVLARAPGKAEDAIPVTARTVEIRAEGRTTVGVSGVDPGEWVVTLGQHLLGGSPARARVRAVTWERVLDLQSRQKEDLLAGFLEKQQRLARTLGAAPPTTDSFSTAPAPARAPAR